MDLEAPVSSFIAESPTMDDGSSSRVEYEVFLSFRGEDTRETFADCLYEQMKGVGIRVFRDDDEIRIGEKIKEELPRAMDNSQIYIPIFSRNYAASKWCLRELAKMVDSTSQSRGNKKILPIFFDADPDDVKLKTPLYRDAIMKLEQQMATRQQQKRLGPTNAGEASLPSQEEHKWQFTHQKIKEEVEKWREALMEVDEIKGWNLKKFRGYGELIKVVIQEVLIKLNAKYKNVTEHFVEDHSQVEAILKILDIGSDGVLFVGIYGMGGIGKTTLSKVIFNKLSSHFEGCVFLEDVRESSRRYGLLSLQKQLLSNILDSRFNNQIHSLDDGVNMIRKGLCTKKVLVVLDDLDKKEQLQKLAGKCEWFGSGSRIMITTRDMSILMTEVQTLDEKYPYQSKYILAYEAQGMKFDQALQLFCKHAFRRNSPPKDYVSLSRQVVSTLGSLPLAVEVIGSSLSYSYNDRALWKDMLKKLQQAPHKNVRERLMISYEGLEYEQKQVFLDIACFFINEDKTCPIFMWSDCQYFPHDAIRILLLRSLIKIRDKRRFWMHDQIRDLGRQIVREESLQYPGKLSRVWIDEEAVDLLKCKERNQVVEAVSLNLSDYTFTGDEIAHLPNLRFLHVEGANFVGNFRNLLLKLRWLSWCFCPSNFTVANFCPANLAVLNLSNSNITDGWGGWNHLKMAKELKVLNLTGCKCLTRMPNLSGFVSLELLILALCSQLITIDCSIGELGLLTTLDLEGCRSLQDLPEEIGSLESLNALLLSGSGLVNLPNSIGNLKKLRVLRMNGTSIRKLPAAIGKVEMLEELHARDCYHLKGEVPNEIGRLSRLRILTLSNTSISSLPTTTSCLSHLQTLELMRCPKLRQLPQLPSSLIRIALEVFHLQIIPDLSDHVYLDDLDLRFNLDPDDTSEKELLLSPWKDGQPTHHFPSSLCILNLEGLKPLPHFSKFKNLWLLYVAGGPVFHKDVSCQQPCEFFMRTLDLSHLKNLRSLTVTWLFTVIELQCLEELQSLVLLHIAHCDSIERLPYLSKLRKLEQLRLVVCPKLRTIEGLSSLGSLKYLRIYRCTSLERFPNVPKSTNIETDWRSPEVMRSNL